MKKTRVKNLPLRLKVLFILSFIGIGITILSNIVKIMSASGTVLLLAFFNDVPGSKEAINQINNLEIHQINYFGFVIISAIISLIGVLMMLKIKKKGFFIYVVGQITPIIAAFILLGGYKLIGGTGFMIYEFVVTFLFILAYSFNVKHLL